MGPRDHRIHLGRMDSLKNSPQNHSSIKQLFSGPFFEPKRSPGQNVDLGIQNLILGIQNLPLGMKIQKMRAEKPYRTPPSELQTEPYGASYGQKPFPSQNLKIWGDFWAPFWKLIGPWRHHLSPHWAPLEDVWGGFVNGY